VVREFKRKGWGGRAITGFYSASIRGSDRWARQSKGHPLKWGRKRKLKDGSGAKIEASGKGEQGDRVRSLEERDSSRRNGTTVEYQVTVLCHRHAN